MRLRFKTSAAWLTLGILVPTLLPSVLCLAQEPTKPAKPETSAQKYKNIKVLKDLPADQLIPKMRSWNVALGVKCDACHVINPDHTGFEKDDKPMKQTAREMVLMATDLNKRQKVVSGQVTCYMCHRGQAEPQRTPLPPTEEPKK
jgi:hypothetical protein